MAHRLKTFRVAVQLQNPVDPSIRAMSTQLVSAVSPDDAANRIRALYRREHRENEIVGTDVKGVVQ